ncbi:MAG: glycine-rich domain-containing protein [Candidatus Micrarchaeia archaeon]
MKNNVLFGIVFLTFLFLFGTAAAGSVIIQNGQINASSNLNASNVLFVNPVTGYVGIGTATSTRPLQIAAAQDANIRLQDTSGASPAAYVEFYNDTTRWGYVGLGGHDDKMTLGTTIEKNLSFYTNNSPKMTITTTGNVGIGTASPAAKLDVNGSIFVEPDAWNNSIVYFANTTGSAKWHIVRMDNDGSLRVTESGVADRVTIQNGTGYVGIGMTNPLAKGHILLGSAGTTPNFTIAPSLILEHSGYDGQLQFLAPSTRASYIMFGDERNYARGGIVYDHRAGSESLALSSQNGSVTIVAGGNVGINTSTPASKLQVAGGEVQTGTSNASCSSSNAGAIRWSGNSFWACNGTMWAYVNLQAPVAATGGTITDIAGYRVHTFTSGGTFTITSGSGPFEILIVGGGGSYGNPGAWGGGMGGAGGVLMGTLTGLSGSYSVVVGAGGTGGSNTGTQGSSSSFGSYTAYGGGYGVNFATYGNGANGGSGGGCGYGGCSGGSSTQTSQAPLVGYGNAGTIFGGGGAGGAGQSYAGGLGIYSTISGQSVYYASGGEQGEGSYIGQGGCGYQSTSGCNGKTGIVIIRYPRP